MNITPEQWDWLIRAIAIALGLVLKQATWYPTKFVPVASIVVSVVVRLATGLGIAVPDVAVDATMATGAYSGVKNLVEGLVGAFKKKA